MPDAQDSRSPCPLLTCTKINHNCRSLVMWLQETAGFRHDEGSRVYLMHSCSWYGRIIPKLQKRKHRSVPLSAFSPETRREFFLPRHSVGRVYPGMVRCAKPFCRHNPHWAFTFRINTISMPAPGALHGHMPYPPVPAL